MTRKKGDQSLTGLHNCCHIHWLRFSMCWQGYFLKESRGGIEGDILHVLSGGLDFLNFSCTGCRTYPVMEKGE